MRATASENRFSRRILNGTFLDWLAKQQPGGRFSFSPVTQTAYVFLASPRHHESEYRTAELHACCLVARSRGGPLARASVSVQKVIGLATEVHAPVGHSMDAIHLDQPAWTDDDERFAAEARDRFGILADPVPLRREL